jgi:hypothetical protein
MQMLVAEDVAMRFRNQSLNANGSYRTLKEGNPAFNKAVDNILNAKKARGERCPSGTKERWWCRLISDGTEEDNQQSLAKQTARTEH